MDGQTGFKLETFFSSFKTVTLKKGQVILRPESVPSGIYYLQEGYVRMFSVSANGQEQTLNIFKPGSYFPMIWAIGQMPNNYFFEAMTLVTIKCAPKAEFLIFIKKEPEVLYELTKRILTGLEGILTMMEALLYGSAYTKVSAVVLMCAKRFGQKGKNGETIINLPLTHQTLSSLAGLTRETTSLEIKKLERKGIIGHQKRNIVLKKMGELEKELLVWKDEISSPHTF